VSPQQDLSIYFFTSSIKNQYSFPLKEYFKGSYFISMLNGIFTGLFFFFLFFCAGNVKFKAVCTVNSGNF